MWRSLVLFMSSRIYMLYTKKRSMTLWKVTFMGRLLQILYVKANVNVWNGAINACQIYRQEKSMYISKQTQSKFKAFIHQWSHVPEVLLIEKVQKDWLWNKFSQLLSINLTIHTCLLLKEASLTLTSAQYQAIEILSTSAFILSLVCNGCWDLNLGPVLN